MCTSNIRALQWDGFHLFRKLLIKSSSVEVWKKVWGSVEKIYNYIYLCSF